MVEHPNLPPMLREASALTRVLLLHAPYPGRLKFDGQPTSLLAATTPLVLELAAEGRLTEVGYLDPRSPSPEAYTRLHELAALGGLRVACISTSTAAIEEAARAAAVIRAESPETLIIAGGPHEDDCEEPIASRVSAVDISISGDAGVVLCLLARTFIDASTSRVEYLRELDPLLRQTTSGSRAVVTSRAMGSVAVGAGSTARLPDDLLRRPWIDRPIRFDVFPDRETLPVMVSRGCAYGRCTFCAEAAAGGQRVASDFSHLRELIASRPRAALYFQDSIFPASRHVRERLLPMLRESGRPWGCQVYLPVLSQSFVELLAKNGCVYAYTGIESGAEEIRAAVGKPALHDCVVYSKLALLAEAGIAMGISLMFGCLDREGRLVETERTIERTEALAERLLSDEMPAAGFYPNVLTVLPGTEIARNLATAGCLLDFYSMPRVPAFEHLEDGGVGYNFASLPGREPGAGKLVDAIATASVRLAAARDRRTAGRFAQAKSGPISA